MTMLAKVDEAFVPRKGRVRRQLNDLRPSLDDINFKIGLFVDNDRRLWQLPDHTYRTLLRLVHFCAIEMVWTDSAPRDGSLPADDDALARIALVKLKTWKAIKDDVLQFFTLCNDRLELNEPWISIGGHQRQAIPAEARREAAIREGHFCAYCGDVEGPFEVDHIFPVVRGGTNGPSNLVLACEECNRSKGGRTLREWVGG